MTKPISFAWIGAFRYSFKDHQRLWSYADAKDWSIGSVGSTPKTLFHRAMVFQKEWNSLQDYLRDYFDVNLPSFDNVELIKWLCESSQKLSVDPTLAQTRGPAVTFLNNVVALKTIEPFAIVSSLVHEHLTVEMKGLPHCHPCWFYKNFDDTSSWKKLLHEYLLMLPGIFLNSKYKGEENLWKWPISSKSSKRPTANISDSFKNKDQIDRWIPFLESHRVLHEYSILSYNYNSSEEWLQICFRDKVTMAQYNKGLICGCIPIPGKPKKCVGKEPEFVRTPEIVFESPVIVDGLKHLSYIWQDKFARSVLLSGPPGAGKELLSTSIPYGNGRCSEALLALSLAEGSLDSLEKRLYGTKREDGSIEKGLISAAEGSALLLDEAHHSGLDDLALPGIRGSLLRPLEAGEYFPVGSNELQKIDNVLFIFATSMPLEGSGKEKSLTDLEPTDFWTRMTHLLQIKHPLEIEENDKLKKVLTLFLKFFWWERVEKYFDIDPATKPDLTKEPGDILLYQQMATLRDLTMDDLLFEGLSQVILDALPGERLKPHELSIRAIRTIVSRLFSIAVYNVTEGGEPCAHSEFIKVAEKTTQEILKIGKLRSKPNAGQVLEPNIGKG